MKAMVLLIKTRFVSLVPLAIAASTLAAVPALAAPFPAQVVPGEVVTVTGTPNLWVADGQGVLHFASDPRALDGRAVDWNTQFALAPDQVEGLPAGDPWLTLALVKIGNDIYLPQPAANAGAPTLRRIQSPDDLGKIGISAGNYGQYVLDLATWEQRYHLSLDRVAFDGDFALIPQPVTPDASSDATAHNDNGSASDTASDVASITEESAS